MGYNIDWVYLRLKHPSRCWHFCATFTVGLVGLISKIVILWFSKASIFNKEILVNALDERPKGIPILTVSNHHSCFDDPGLWSVLRFNQVCNRHVIRWSLAAHDICFTRKLHSLFFMFGKCIPCIRGGGVYQPGIDLCIEKLKLGEWVHIFPEGKVNMAKESLRLKWGVGRMIFETPVIPIVIPIWHIGMDTILPNAPPYYIRTGKKVTYNFGKPIDLNATIASIRESNVDEVEARRLITEKIQEAMYVLRDQTEQLHMKGS